MANYGAKFSNQKLEREIEIFILLQNRLKIFDFGTLFLIKNWFLAHFLNRLVNFHISKSKIFFGLHAKIFSEIRLQLNNSEKGYKNGEWRIMVRGGHAFTKKSKI